MSVPMIDLADLAKHACIIARAAGEAILQVYRSDFAVEQKIGNTHSFDLVYALRS